jgi:hypothetical protein
MIGGACQRIWLGVSNEIDLSLPGLRAFPVNDSQASQDNMPSLP